MQLTLIKKDYIYECILPEKQNGQYWIMQVNKNMQEEKVIGVEGYEDNWFLTSNKKVVVRDENKNKLSKVMVEPLSFYNIFFLNEKEEAFIYSEPITENRKTYKKLLLTPNIKITIGRSSDCDILYENKFVSSYNTRIELDGTNIKIIDLNSKNGTFVNGNRIKSSIVSPGDIVYILGLKIIIGKGFIAVNNPDGKIQCNFEKLMEFLPQKLEENEEEEKESSEEKLFFRSPRFKRDIERVKIRIDSPPALANGDEMPLILILGPALTMGLTSLFTGVITLENVLATHGSIMTAMPALIMSFSMLVGTVLFPILSKKVEKKRKEKREKVRQIKYREYLERVDQRIVDECINQSKILYENNIALDECITRIKLKQRNLWERTYDHNDFIKIRLGIGSVPLDAEISYSEKSFTIDEDNLRDELYKLVDKPKVLDQVPVTMSLLEENITGIIGERDVMKEFVKGMIIELSALHSYDELKFVFLYDEGERKDWKFSKWMPYVWDKEKSIRFIATNLLEVKELSVYFEKELKRRRGNKDDEGIEGRLPYYIIFAASKELAQKAEFINKILKLKKNYGFSLVALYDELKNLPKECATIIEIHRAEAKLYDKNDITGKHVDFKPDIFLKQDAEELAIDLANIHLDSTEGKYNLPSVVTFLEMYGVGKIEHLNPLMRWQKNDPTVSLEIPIGIDTSGELFKLDLHEKYHGPHGLIAGMTGSGKSEFIMTLIMSLALNYHPYEVAFILIDYKGGGMANAFTNLPHLAGTITNLDGASVKRSLVSIQSELKRRQAIFSETSKKVNVSNIDIYKYQKLYRAGIVKEPLQHLFIISDEFAELKTQQPEFMNQLVSAARIGRSLGIHLILATQKPSGVVDDQIWSNTRFRICLKVQEKDDSMDVIKRPDAAELSKTGRFYLQVGFNELFELGQSAWGGAPYYPEDQVEKEEDSSVAVIDNLGRIVKQIKLDRHKGATKNPPKQIDEINKYLSKLAKNENIKIRPLWLPEIPKVIYIEQLRSKYEIGKEKRNELNPIIGEIDDPSNQSQSIMRIPITEEGNVIIYGTAGNGKTTFLMTLLYSLIREHSSKELNIYALDFAAETLKVFEKAPQVGDVVFSYENEKINNLFKMLNSEIEKRKKQLSSFGGDFTTYVNRENNEIPFIVVLIHNFSAFAENYESLSNDIEYLTREGTKYGIYFIVTAANTSAVRFRLLQGFKQLYVLQLNDILDYSSVLGNTQGTYPANYKGRGIFKKDEVYEFQTAIFGEKGQSLFEHAKQYCEAQRNSWKGKGARKIPILPDKVDLKYLEEAIKEASLNKLPIAVDKNSLKIVDYDFKSAYINFVISEVNDNAKVIQGLAEAIEKINISKVLVIDALGSFYKDETRKYGYFKEDLQFEKLVLNMFETLVYRNNNYKDKKENGEQLPTYEPIVYIINSLSSLKAKLSSEGNGKLIELLERGSSVYNVNFIISEDMSSLKTYSFENWCKKNVTWSNGIWLGGGISGQYQIKVTTPIREGFNTVEEGFGYIVSKGKAKLVKLLETSLSEEEDIFG